MHPISLIAGIPPPPSRAIVTRGFTVSHVGFPRRGYCDPTELHPSDELFTITKEIPTAIKSI